MRFLQTKRIKQHIHDTRSISVQQQADKIWIDDI
jgi:hypothetical protein